jgi:hypothetical protein
MSGREVVKEMNKRKCKRRKERRRREGESEGGMLKKLFLDMCYPSYQ